MSTSTAEIPVQVDGSAIAHLDFVPELRCEATPLGPGDRCELVAVWWRTCRACGDRVPYCETHRLGFAVAMAQLALRRGFVGCAVCDAIVPARLWPIGYVFLPIGGA